MTSLREQHPGNAYSPPASGWPQPSGKTRVAVPIISAGYLLFVHLVIGLHIEHIALVLLYNIGFAAHPVSRRFMAAMTVFLIYGVLYDAMKAWPNHLANTVDIEQIYLLEKQLFGIHSVGAVLTPNEFFRATSTAFLDLATGLIYLNWVSVPLAFGIYLYFIDARSYLDFALVFLLVNILGFVLYYLHPAAPPWYVEQYGFVFREGVSGSAAGLLRFDSLVGMDIFQAIYTRNSNVFAAVPSLHAAYPLIVLYYGLRTKRSAALNVFFGLFTLGIWFSAVYSGHHYVIDVALGAACAVIGIALYHGALLRIPSVQRGLEQYRRAIQLPRKNAKQP